MNPLFTEIKNITTQPPSKQITSEQSINVIEGKVMTKQDLELSLRQPNVTTKPECDFPFSEQGEKCDGFVFKATNI